MQNKKEFSGNSNDMISTIKCIFEILLNKKNNDVDMLIAKKGWNALIIKLLKIKTGVRSFQGTNFQAQK